MYSRYLIAAGVLMASAAPVLAGGAPCGRDCYRETTLAPVYGTVAERVLLSPPRTVDVVKPAVYATVSETVQVGGGRVWTVTRDRHGRKVGCWVETPPVFETRPRTVLVSGAYSEPHTYPALFGSRERTVLLEPARREWVPLGGHGFGAPGLAPPPPAPVAVGHSPVASDALAFGAGPIYDRPSFGRSRYGNRVYRQGGNY